MNLRSLIALALIAGCGPTLAAGPPGVRSGVCFHERDVNNFRAVDERTVNIRVGISDVYRLHLFATCGGVTWAETIGLLSRPGEFICSGTANDVEVFFHSEIGRRNCPVGSIEPLSAAQVAALPKKQRP